MHLRAHPFRYQITRLGGAGNCRLHWTYQVLTENLPYVNLHQGYSYTYPSVPDRILREGDQGRLQDPAFRLNLPLPTCTDRRRVTIKWYCWLSRGNQRTVKWAFTKIAAQAYLKLLQVHRGDGDLARMAFNQWLEEHQSRSKVEPPYMIDDSDAVSMTPRQFSSLERCIDQLVPVDETLVCSVMDKVDIYRSYDDYTLEWIMDDGLTRHFTKSISDHPREIVFSDASDTVQVEIKMLMRTRPRQEDMTRTPVEDRI